MDPEQLIANSTVAAVVSDPRQKDNPIIACNQAFVDLTGYQREEVLGRNCRFLRGEKTEANLTEMLRLAVTEVRPEMVELMNYKKEGMPFRNAVMIAPLFDDEGKLQFFLGSQMEISSTGPSRHEKARELIESLSRRQRQVLEALAKGLINKQIAFELGLTERTVKMHRAAMLNRLGAKTIADAMRIAIEAGL